MSVLQAVLQCPGEQQDRTGWFSLCSQKFTWNAGGGAVAVAVAVAGAGYLGRGFRLEHEDVAD